MLLDWSSIANVSFYNTGKEFANILLNKNFNWINLVDRIHSVIKSLANIQLFTNILLNIA